MLLLLNMLLNVYSIAFNTGYFGGQITLGGFGGRPRNPQTIFTPKLIYQGKFYQREFNEIC